MNENTIEETQSLNSKKECKAEYDKAYYEKNKERINAKKCAYYEKNKERILAKRRARRARNKDDISVKVRAYYDKNKERVLAHHAKKKEHKAKYQKAWYEKNKERIIAQTRAYRAKNKGNPEFKERIRAQERAYRTKNKERILANYEKNKERILAHHRAYYEKNKDDINAKQRAYYEKNKDDMNAKSRAYYEKNKDDIKAWAKANYAKNKECILAKSRANYAKNKGNPEFKERIKVWRKAYHAKNKERINEKKCAWCAKKKQEKLKAQKEKLDAYFKKHPERKSALWSEFLEYKKKNKGISHEHPAHINIHIEYLALNYSQKQDWIIDREGGTSNHIKSGDKGVDGWKYIKSSLKGVSDKMIYSVKTGNSTVLGDIRELKWVMDDQMAIYAGLIMDAEPTKGMLNLAKSFGVNTYKGAEFQKVQILTSSQIINGETFNLPPAEKQGDKL